MDICVVYSNLILFFLERPLIRGVATGVVVILHVCPCKLTNSMGVLLILLLEGDTEYRVVGVLKSQEDTATG